MESWLLAGLIFLACPVGIGLAMWFMGKSMGGHSPGQASMQGNAVPPEERLALLEAERQALERQIAATDSMSPEEEKSMPLWLLPLVFVLAVAACPVTMWVTSKLTRRKMSCACGVWAPRQRALLAIWTWRPVRLR